MMKRFPVLLVLLLFSLFARGQEAHCFFGGYGGDVPVSIVPTGCNNYFVIGVTESWGVPYHGFLSKLDANMQVLWTKSVKGARWLYLMKACATNDNGLAIIADDDFSNRTDIVVIKADSSGNIQWKQAVKLPLAADRTEDIIQTADGGYVITGSTNSFSGRTSLFIMKLDSLGQLVFFKTYLAGAFSIGINIFELADKNLVVTGRCAPNAFYILKTDPVGQVLDSKGWGLANLQELIVVQAVTHAEDGGFAITGTAGGPFNVSASNIMVMKVDSNLEFEWMNLYASGYNQYSLSIMQMSNGNYFVGGGFTDTITPNATNTAAYYLWMDSSGTPEQAYFRKPLTAPFYGNDVWDAIPEPYGSIIAVERLFDIFVFGRATAVACRLPATGLPSCNFDFAPVTYQSLPLVSVVTNTMDTLRQVTMGSITVSIDPVTLIFDSLYCSAGIVPCLPMTIAYGITDASSSSASDGIVHVMVSGGQPPYYYSLDNVSFQTDNIFTALNSGQHMLYVTDSNGCTTCGAFVIGVAPCTSLSLSFSVTAAVTGQNDGAVKVIVSGGEPPYLYSLDSVIFQSNSTFLDLDTGIYEMYVTDSNGCTGKGVFTIDFVSGVSRVNTDFKVYPNPFSDRLTIEVNATPINNLRMIDVYGREVYRYPAMIGTRQTLTIDPCLPEGIYFLQINGSYHTQKLIRVFTQ